VSETPSDMSERGRLSHHLGLSTPGLAAIWLVLATLGCTTTVVRDVDETQANRIVATLTEQGIVADKKPIGDEGARYTIVVASKDVTTAINALSRAELPSASPAGVLDALSDKGLVQSQRSEEARLLLGIAGELERSLSELAQVQSARVHLAVPRHEPLLEEEEQARPSASVLLRHRGATPPIAPENVKALVAGAVPGLSPERVTVINASVPAPTHKGPALAQFGPFLLAESSAKGFRATVLMIALVDLVLVAVLGWFWWTLRRLRLSQKPDEQGRPSAD